MKAALSLTPPSRSDDRALAGRIAAGDAEAFAVLMRRHNQPLFRIARAILKDAFEAEDALQGAYLKAYARIGTYAGEAKLSTWLTRIVINESLGRLRKRKGDRTVVSFAEGRIDAAQEDAVSVDKSCDPEASAERSQIRALLERKLLLLPVAFRTVFMLREVEELSVTEVAESLEIPEATVRSRLFRAKGLLRESISRDIGDALDDVFEFGGDRCDRLVASVLERIGDLPRGAT